MMAALGRARWAVTDGWVVGRANMINWRRNPGLIFYCMMFPIMTVVFGYVFGSAMSVEGGGDYRAFLMPGLFGQAMMFGVVTSMLAVTSAVSRGVTDRFRSMPMAQSGVALGRSFADMFSSLIELTILLVCGLLVGWRWHEGPGKALAALGLLLLWRYSLIWVGIYLGLLLPPDAAGAAYVPLLPLTMLANTFVSPEKMPGWLGHIAEWNPLSSTVSACRELFGNPGVGGDSWVTDHAVALAVAWPVLLLVIFMPLSVRRYRTLSR
ncbi:ABC transporter permease [Streptomyces mobaraensis NBRC 13819 = DSM 40847]|uniref:Transport permease protein n=2 Tax=Streptomyces mobaraensis TaxID=35621 RepID=A0A5N5WAD2_STRMB|nr:ABC transporter permease [Streptomyces mobaraensis]EMF01577.1 ABC transporter [Streptomyces mobaraensis NBRC 13819 = DSM 40847]KAB7847739.1 ABC transporter permease [Streptomyces mobaraensis]QTT74963.1 ABC transporter permease [Streptomyces mobaraensis NBRC 13819 = DSM 40847]